MEGVLSSAQMCIAKAMLGLKCKSEAGNFHEGIDFLTKAWKSDPSVVKQPNGFLKGNFDGDPPRRKKERRQCFWDVLQQFG